MKNLSQLVKNGVRKIITDQLGQDVWAGLFLTGYWQTVREAGFAGIQIVVRHLLTLEELEAMVCCSGEEFTPTLRKEDHIALEGKVASVKFTAMKLPLDEESIEIAPTVA
ncbi:MAG: hypothetical protein J7L69_08320 [Desulfobulbaceae bacterium]|nr:hypothetical protein [Desulfobulbaceae bacterium]